MTNWGSPFLPAGADNDPNAPYNQKDHSHDHEWEHNEHNLSPEFEDGGVIFHEVCMYAEGQYGEEWQCEEERSYRFEYSTLETPEGGELLLNPHLEGDDETIEERVIEIEMAFHNHRDEVTLDVDPDPDYGVVSISYDGYTLNYSYDDIKALIEAAQVFDSAAQVHRAKGDKERAISRRKLAFGARKWAREMQ